MKILMKNQSGNVALLTALLIVPIILVLGGTIDMMRVLKLRAEIQDAIDGGVLAAAALTNEAAAEDVIEDFIDATLSARGVDTDALAVVVESSQNTTGKQVRVTAQMSLPTVFLGIIGRPNYPIRIESRARQDWQNVEIALVLDVSGSMATNNKIGSMRTAAEEFIEAILTEDAVDLTSLSVIPFGTHTNGGADMRQFANPARIDTDKDNNFADGHRWLGCLNIRPGQYTLAPPTLGTLDPLPEFRDYRLCANSNNSSLFLTNDETTLVNHVRGLTSETSLAGGTGIDEGVAVGLWSLVPSMRGRFSSTTFGATRPMDYNTGVLKILVLMTDGDLTKWYRPLTCWNYTIGCVEWPIENATGEATFVALCDAATAAGITVYTIGFNIADGSRADTVLEDCVSNPSNYIWVEGTDVGAAFASIAAKINAVRLVM